MNSEYNILTVDDSSSMRSMIKFTLGESGYHCDEAENGAIALEKAQEKKYDLILMDINMPVMDGIEAIGYLREMDQYKNKPIIVLSTESGKEIKAKGRAAGATGWMVKPFDPDKLISALRRVLN